MMSTTHRNFDAFPTSTEILISRENIAILNILIEHPIEGMTLFNFTLALLDLKYLDFEFELIRQTSFINALEFNNSMLRDEGLELTRLEMWKRMIDLYIISLETCNEIPAFSTLYQDLEYLSIRVSKGWESFLLSNSGMHATNGNIISSDERYQQIAPSTEIKAQAFEIKHNLKWDAGDNVINGFCNWLGFNGKKSESIKTSYKSCVDGGVDIMSVLTDRNTILIFLIASLLIFGSIKSNNVRYLVCFIIGYISFKKATSSEFEFLDLCDLHIVWENSSPDDLEMEPVIKAEAFTIDTPVVSKLLLASISCLAGYQVKKSLLSALLATTKITDNQSSNVTGLIIYVTTSIHDFLISIEQEKMATYFEIDAVGDDRVSNYQKQVIEFVASFNSGNPESMLYCMDVYKNLYDEGRFLDSCLDKRSYDHRVVMDCFTKLVSVYSKIEDLKLSLSGERIEPVGILLRGEPATLKGVLTKRIAKVISAATLPEEWKTAYKQSSKDFFFSVPVDQFWDGYTNKAWTTFYDDIFQRRDAVADSDSDGLKIIKMINSAPYTLKMATIAQKNNVFFRSAFVIANSNITDFKQLQSVTDYEAVHRRFHIEVEVKINPKYAKNGVIDVSKLPPSVDVENAKNIPNDFWHLYYQERVGMNMSEPKQITIQELIKFSVSRHYEHRQNFFSNRKAEERIVEELSSDLGYNWQSFVKSEIKAEGPMFPEASYKKLMEHFANMPYYERAQYDKAWWHFCASIERTDLGLEDFDVVLKYIVPYDVDVSSMVEVMHEPTRLVALLAEIVQDSLNAGFNPITRCPDWRNNEPPQDSPLERLKNIFLHFLSIIKNNWIYIVLGILLSAATLKALHVIFSSFATHFGSESVDFKTFGKRVVGRKHNIKLSSKLHDRPNIVSQSGVPVDFEFSGLPKFSSLDFGVRNNHNDVTAKIFNKSFFLTYIVEPDGTDFDVVRLGHSINLVGQLFLMPMHFIYVLDGLRKRESYKGAVVIFVTSSGSNRYSVPLEEVLLNFKSTDTAADKDVCLVKIDCSQRMAKGCLESFLTVSDLNNLMRTTSFQAHVLGSYHVNNTTSNISIRNHYTRASMNKGAMVVAAEWEREKFQYSLFDNFLYDINSSGGDCGSLLLASESNYENRIICGMHVAGGAGTGVSVCLSREMLDELIQFTFPSDGIGLDEDLPSFLEQLDIVESQGSMVPLFKLKSSHVPGEVFKSEIRKSRLYRNLPVPFDSVTHFPSKLKPFYNDSGELIDPLMKAFNKYGKIAPDIPSNLLSEAVESYENLFNNHVESDQGCRDVIDLKTALHSFDRINSISSSTSSGFPMSLPCEEDLKKLYFKAIEDRDVIEENRIFGRIAILVQDAIDSYKSGIRPFYAYKQCGKDEIRELHKIVEGKTRLFSACPFILLALFRMYFGAFVNDFVKANSNIGSAVGVNPYSAEWDRIARLLLQFGNSDDDQIVAAGDQGQFDTRQWTIIHDAILDMINRYYGNRPEENFIRSCLFKEITNSRHVFRGVIYEWNSGLPSGNPLTAIINTIYNNIVFRMSWGISGLKINEFNSKCYLIVLGDDNCFSVEESCRQIFNELKLPEYMAKIGMEYTTELKGDAVFPFRKLSDVEFLKRSFRKDKKLNRWVAPLRESAVASMLNWTKKGKEGNQITLDNMVFALREFSLHGKKKFEFWRDSLVDLKQKHFQYMVPHGDMPLNFENTYKAVLDLEYYF